MRAPIQRSLRARCSRTSAPLDGTPEQGTGTAGRSISQQDGPYHNNPLDRYSCAGQTRSMRVELPRRPRVPELFAVVAFILSFCLPGRLLAQPGVAKTRTTLIIFSERRMRDEEWSALFDALKRGVRSESTEAPALGGADFLRGDQIARGTEVSQPLSVYLHGDCSLLPMARTFSPGALGWVWRVRGQIEPFIHVECGEIAQVLGPMAMGLNRKRRDTLMGEAMARVILHEWIHVATQNPEHAKGGVEKAQFSLADLLAYDEEVRRDPRILKRRWNL